ncbi:unnamed protein product [Anisakis simplex]|uniref:Ly-6-related protein HOT-5 (inferred by orthology to a C. elegans protein) n=1 Tax=Anisakis simplex TaxID=6269 RepID=A0A0M3JYM8_ANISI|nr:unnamed protein product [Anisakis simplex]
MPLFVLFIMLVDVTNCLKCFSCASADYEPLFERSATLRHSLSIPRFGDLCDSVEKLHAIAPVETCPSTCISLLEPQYFGGVQLDNTPYTYIRGCASTLFASISDRPREIDFLHTEAICLPLRLSQIWPSIQTDEHVQVRFIMFIQK